MPSVYSSKSLELLRQHITLHFGKAEYYMQMFLENGLLVEIDVVKPTSYRNFYTLVTVGLGAYLNPNAALDGCAERCELTFFLPANWQQNDSEWNEDNRNWPIELLKTFIQKTVEEGVGLNTIVDNGAPFGNNTQQSQASLIEQVDDDMRLCRIDDEGIVEFLSVFVLFKEEADYMAKNGPEELMKAIDDDLEIIQVAPLCLKRKNIFNPNNKKYWLTYESQILTDWSDGPYCYASDSIMVDGKPIGYCYRVEPDETDTLGWDSGWRFFAADDDEEYRKNPKNIGNFELNTLCNVDSLILPLLRAPYGSAFRKKEGAGFVFEFGPMAPLQKSLLTDAVREKLKEYELNVAADYVDLIKYLRDFVYKSVDKGVFSIDDARSNLELSLWYAYACINTDSYEQSFEATMLMPFAENYALGSGCWYYRYSCALTHCGQLKKALRYAEYGTVQEPAYPWNWLQVGKLRAHFGNTEGALDAVNRGLELEPENYEFLTLQREIKNGASLEQMEYHVIDPETDQRLQDGSLPGAEQKKKLVAGMVCNEKNLNQVKAMFQPMTEWNADAPYCTFTWNIMPEEPLVIGFGMNEAALSKMDLTWLWAVREKLDGNKYRRQVDQKGVETTLVTVMIGWDHHIDLIYQYPNSNKLMRVAMKV